MCGIFGVFGHPEAANLTYLGLHALQHRGQEAAGITVSDGDHLRTERVVGLVGEGFSQKQLRPLKGPYAIGHVRYSTAGEGGLRNAQPFCVDYAHGSVAVAHNGNLINAVDLRKRLELDGSIFQSTVDSEVVVHLLARARELDSVNRVITALRQVEGAYSFLFLTENQLVAARDPRGFRPLCIGRLKEAFVFSSETVAFDLIGAEFIREVEPGEVVVVDNKGLHSHKPWAVPENHRFCVFEHVYFARPDSYINGRSVYAVRHALGRHLAREYPVEADVVIPVPDSGVPAAIGYAEQSGIPFAMGLVRSHYVGRTFIEPEQSIRHFGVKLKLNAVRQVLEGKRVIIVDDSLVRGTTARKIVKMVRGAGAREVHLRISSPPITHPCFYGIDTPTRSELIASSHSPDEIARYVTSNSLRYLSREGMMEAVDEATPEPAEGPKRLRVIGEGYCDACFTGNYPVQFHAGELSSLRRIIN